MFSLFGLVATALAGIGAFGLVLFLVRRRTREIGVRIALGEPPIRTIGSVVAWGLRWSLIGIGAGALSVIALRPAVAGLLFGVSPLEPGILAGCAAALLILTVAAAVGPAARAARIGPLRALRSD